MIIALITASVLGIYLLWTGRRKMKRCLTCTKKQKVVDVPKDLEFEIAQANVLPANVLPRVMSESWTAATAVTRGIHSAAYGLLKAMKPDISRKNGRMRIFQTMKATSQSKSTLLEFKTAMSQPGMMRMTAKMATFLLGLRHSPKL